MHAFPALDAALTTRKTLHERGGDPATTRLVMRTLGDGRTVRLQISRRELEISRRELEISRRELEISRRELDPADEPATARGWRLRLQLPPTVRVRARARA